MAVHLVHRYLATRLMRRRRPPSRSPLFDGLTDDQLGELAGRRRRGRRSSPGVDALPRGRAGRPLVGARRRRRSSCVRHVGPRGHRGRPDGRARAAGPAGSGRGTSTASTSPPAAACTPGPAAARPGRRCCATGARVVPVRRPPHRGAVPHRPHHRVDRAPARVPGHARHPGRRARPRAQQPGRGRDPRGRRARRRLPGPAGLARAAGRGRHLRRASSWRSTSCAARSGPAPHGGLRWPWRTARRSSPAWLARHDVADALAAGRGAREPRASTWPGASGWRTARWSRPLRPGLEWVASTLSASTPARRGPGGHRPGLRAGPAVRSYTQMDRPPCSRSTSPRASRAPW